MQSEVAGKKRRECYTLGLIMPNRRNAFHLLTPRDLATLDALDKSPLTAAQLLKLSETFGQPFASERRVRERMRVNCKAGRARASRYVVFGTGAPACYRLSRLGYQLVHGEGAMPPAKRYFAETGVSHQRHTHALANFLVHTLVAAHRSGIAVENFARENTVRLQIGDEVLMPDAAFQLLAAGSTLNYFVELDNGTERVVSTKNVESWQRKLRLYKSFAQTCNSRFRLLVVATHRHDRLLRILNLAQNGKSRPATDVVYGVSLADYLAASQPLTAPCFFVGGDRAVSLLPAPSITARTKGYPRTRSRKSQPQLLELGLEPGYAADPAPSELQPV